MQSRSRIPLVRVWALTVMIFVVAAGSSRWLTRLATVLPSYLVGLVGLLAIAAALVMSRRGLGDPGIHTPRIRRILRGAVAVGAILWILAMVFPFL